MGGRYKLTGVPNGVSSLSLTKALTSWKWETTPIYNGDGHAVVQSTTMNGRTFTIRITAANAAATVFMAPDNKDAKTQQGDKGKGKPADFTPPTVKAKQDADKRAAEVKAALAVKLPAPSTPVPVLGIGKRILPWPSPDERKRVNTPREEDGRKEQ